MESQLYYTRQELFNQKHNNYIETDTNIMFTQDSSKFNYYKKLYILKPNASDVTEIYVELKVYMVVVQHLNSKASRWMNEFEAYVFYSIEDYMKCLGEANKNRLF